MPLIETTAKCGCRRPGGRTSTGLTVEALYQPGPPGYGIEESIVFGKQGIVRDLGLLLVLMAAAFFVSVVAFVEVDIDREAIGESLQEIVDDQSRYVASWSFNLAGGLLLIVAGVGLFLVMRVYDQALAIIVMVGLAAAGVTLMAATMSYFVLFFLANDFVVLNPVEAAALASTARAVGLAAITIHLTGLTLVGVSMVPIGVLIASSGAVPRWMGWWAVISGVLMLFTWAILAYVGAGFAVIAAGSAGALLFFVMLGLWLLIRGLSTPVTEIGLTSGPDP